MLLHGDSAVTALGIVAHEVGHAVQHAQGHRVSRVRTGLARTLGHVAQVSPLVFVDGMLFGSSALMGLGRLMLAGQAALALGTLPVERDASHRAAAMLDKSGLALPEEEHGVRQVRRAVSTR